MLISRGHYFRKGSEMEEQILNCPSCNKVIVDEVDDNFQSHQSGDFWNCEFCGSLIKIIEIERIYSGIYYSKVMKIVLERGVR